MDFAWLNLPFTIVWEYLESFFRFAKLERFMDWVLRGFNLWLIYWIFRQNARERRGERQRDSNKESRKFATQELILKPNFKLLTDFFDETEKRLKGVQTVIEAEWGQLSPEQIYSKIELDIASFKSSLDPVKARIVRPLVHLSSEFNSVSTNFEKIEDSFTEYLQLALKPKAERDYQRRLSSFQSMYEDVIKSILDGQREFLVSVDSTAPPFPREKNSWKVRWPITRC